MERDAQLEGVFRIPGGWGFRRGPAGGSGEGADGGVFRCRGMRITRCIGFLLPKGSPAKAAVMAGLKQRRGE